MNILGYSLDTDDFDLNWNAIKLLEKHFTSNYLLNLHLEQNFGLNESSLAEFLKYY